MFEIYCRRNNGILRGLIINYRTLWNETKVVLFAAVLSFLAWHLIKLVGDPICAYFLRMK